MVVWMVLKTVTLPLPDSDNQADIVSSNLKLPDIQIVKKSNFKEISRSQKFNPLQCYGQRESLF